MRNRYSIRMLSRCAMLLALNCVCAWIAVPVGDIFFTLQTFSVFLTLSLLGGKWGTMTVCGYLLLGIVGLPVFSGFRGGLGALMSPTGGYLMGFLVIGLCHWSVVSLFGQRMAPAGLLVGLVACYSLGTGWYILWYADDHGVIPILLKCVVPFVIPDILKLTLACMISDKLKRSGVFRPL